MRLINCIRTIKLPRWSTMLPFLFYLLFILLILRITFPLKSSDAHNIIQEDDHMHHTHAAAIIQEKSINTNNLEDDSLVGNLPGIALLDKNGPMLQMGNVVGKQQPMETVILSNTNDGSNLLKVAFGKADLDKDGTLSIQELARYINSKIRDHIDMAIKTNPQTFAEIDLSPRDGLISWDEYHAYFLRERGLDEDYIQQHNEKRHTKLNRKAKEEIMKDKALWAEAARSDPFSLTLDEFLSFRHPESSTANLLSLVDDLLRLFDVNGDDHLTIEEFSNVSADDFDERWRTSTISKTIEERKEEFKKLIDRNHDGLADRAELLAYVDPKHPRYALQEAATLFNLADVNKDMKLTLHEVLNNSKTFIVSKMIDTSQSFHDEF